MVHSEVQKLKYIHWHLPRPLFQYKELPEVYDDFVTIARNTMPWLGKLPTKQQSGEKIPAKQEDWGVLGGFALQL